MSILVRELWKKVRMRNVSLLWLFKSVANLGDTRKQYIYMQHPELQSCSFYFNPCRDLFWLSIYVTEEPEFLQDLIHCYGEQLDNIKRVFVEELDWEEKTPAGYTRAF
jgi:hypothetical protein